MDLKQLPFSPKLPYRDEERRVQPSREHALSKGPGQAGAAEHRAHGRQPQQPQPQPTARPQEGEADSPGSGHCGWGVQVRTRATSQGPKLAREGPEHLEGILPLFLSKSKCIVFAYWLGDFIGKT